MAGMTIDLINLQPQSISKNLKGKYIMLYGQPKCGKTTLASQFDKVLIAGFEAGTNALDNVFVQPIKTWSDWKTCVRQLCTNQELKDKFYTIAIDTADQAWQLVDKYICNLEGVDDISDVAYGKLYKKKLDEFMSTFRDLSYEGYGLLFISHATEKTYVDDKGVENVRTVPSLPSNGTNNPFDAINKFVDIIAYIQTEPVQKGEDVVYERNLCFRSTTKYLAGSRLAFMPDKISLSYDNLVSAVNNAIDTEAAQAGKEATKEGNPYTIKSFNECMDEARELWKTAATKGRIKDVLQILQERFGKPTKFSDVKPEQFDLLVESLKEVNALLDD